MQPTDTDVQAEMARAARTAQGHYCPVRNVTISAMRSCSGCGWLTYAWCDNMCLAEDHMPQETWYAGQTTPLCSACERVHGECHCCRQESWCTPGPHRDQPLPCKGRPCVHEKYPATTQEVTDFSDAGMHWTPEEFVARIASDSGDSQQAVIQQCLEVAVREMYRGDAAAFYLTPAQDGFTEWLRLMAIMRPAQCGLRPTNTSIRVTAAGSSGYTWMHTLPSQ